MIPEEVAQELLRAFGITKATAAYERWVKPDGFKKHDFGEVFYENPFFYGIDWRAVLEEELKILSKVLQRLQVQLDYDLNSDYVSGRVHCDGKSAKVRYCPADDGADANAVLLAIRKVIPDRIQILALRGNGGSDTVFYLIQSREVFESLSTEAKAVIDDDFEPLAEKVSRKVSDSFTVKQNPPSFPFKLISRLISSIWHRRH